MENNIKPLDVKTGREEVPDTLPLQSSQIFFRYYIF